MNKKSRRKRFKKRTRKGGDMSVEGHLRAILIIAEDPDLLRTATPDFRQRLMRLRTDTERMLAMPESDPNYTRELMKYCNYQMASFMFERLGMTNNRRLMSHLEMIALMMRPSRPVPEPINNPQ
jgi:hypothetical protein